MSKGFSVPRRTKTEQKSRRIKFFGLTNQSFKFLAQTGRSMCYEEFMKDLQHPVSHQP